MTTFERLYIADPATHEEVKDPYYTWYNEEAACRRILAEFGLPGTSHIVNGHVPVREKSGESPIKGGGRLVVIDGGFCRATMKRPALQGIRWCTPAAPCPCGPISPLSVPKRP